jgi:hypothetical protein
MPTTRRRKIARRSVAVRRVKPNAKRKTYRRKSRNIVMKGGVHESLKVYVIQKKLGKPKCFIIKKARRGFRDDLYLIFDADLDQAEINEFACAAMGLESTVHIEPALAIEKYREGEAFNNLFIRLRGFKSYSMESGLLSNSKTISEGSFTKHTISGTDTKMEKWEDVIKKLEEKSNSKEGYTFTPFDKKYVMDEDEITKRDLESLFDDIIEKTMSEIKEDCKGKPILDDIRKLNIMINTQSSIKNGIDNLSKDFAFGKSSEKNKEQDKQNTISSARARFPRWDAEKAKELIQQIKSNQSFNLCRNAISEDEMYMARSYLDSTQTFKSIEEIANDSYQKSY